MKFREIRLGAFAESENFSLGSDKLRLRFALNLMAKMSNLDVCSTKTSFSVGIGSTVDTLNFVWVSTTNTRKLCP